MAKRKKIKMAGMVGWFHPISLLRTGIEVVISGVFGRNADRRLLQALSDDGGLREKVYYDFSDLSDDDFWFDYISDVGDGFNSTYTMAHHLSQPRLDLRSPDKTTHETRQGRILIFGGDEVYPVASRSAYHERLIIPYRTAFPAKNTGHGTEEDDGLPAVFAIPGNHDWYDSLVSFLEYFCRENKFGGWRTMQNRSYFALKFPQGWWLFATDMQLGSALDKPQMEYFSKVMKNQVGENDRIILCNAEPYWIKAKLNENDPDFSDRNLGFFEGHILNHQTAVFIAGDLHYYRRHEEVTKEGDATENPRQKITAGGGGAFLHPTHKQNVERLGKRSFFKLRKSFPSEQVSKKLSWWNLLFPVWNPLFGLVTGLLYLLTAKAFLSDLGRFKLSEFGQALGTVVHDALVLPFAIYWVLLIFIGVVLFTGSKSPVYRAVAGPIHALAHLLALFLISWAVSAFLSGEYWLSINSSLRLALAGVMIFISGWLVGSFIFGIYLLISLNVFGRHANEAFSALKIADHKNFVRFKIEKNGDLVIFPVGIEQVTKWKEDPSSTGPRLVPRTKQNTKNEPALIEPPVRFAKPFTADTSAQETSEGWKWRAKPID